MVDDFEVRGGGDVPSIGRNGEGSGFAGVEGETGTFSYDLNALGDPRAARDRGEYLAFDDVEARLVDAVRCSWRMSDREKGWLRVKTAWPEFRRHTSLGDYYHIDDDEEPAPEPLSRTQIAAMEQALAWVASASDEDRRLIALALRAKAAGAKRVPWTRLLKPMGVKHGAHGLRKRYSRAMVGVCEAANADHLARKNQDGSVE